MLGICLDISSREYAWNHLSNRMKGSYLQGAFPAKFEMDVLVATPAMALPACVRTYQRPIISKSPWAMQLHLHSRSTCLALHFYGSKKWPSSGKCTLDYPCPYKLTSRLKSKYLWSFNRKQRWNFLAGLVADFRGNREAGHESGRSLGRFLKRGASGLKIGNDSQSNIRDVSLVTQGPEKDLSKDISESTDEILENGTEPPLKTSQLIKSAEFMKDRLLEAALRQVSQAKGLATNTPWANYFNSVDASPGTPLLPFLGDSLLGLGSLVFVAVALASWWRKIRHGTRVSNIGELEPRNPPSAQQVRNVQAAVAAPLALSLFLRSDMKKKESAEWLNMVVGKVWNLYRRKLESALVRAIQPVLDEIPEKPPYVERVVIKQFFLGDEPVTLRNIERRTSRRANDLQYHIGLRYTGNSRMVFSITLKIGFLPIKIPIGIRGLDLDGEVWVKLRLIPTEPWVGTATWAFVTPPKVTLALAPFRLLNLMAVPFLNIFLTKLLTQDLPLLFVRPNKQVVNYLKGKTAGPLVKDFKDGIFLKGFAGELSITLLEARKLNYFPIGTTDPYVVFLLGEQVIRSKRNSKTSIIGPRGAPVWNQDFRMLVVNPETQELKIRVRDFVGYLGLTTITVGSIEVPLNDLQDTVPVDKVLPLRNSRWFFLGRSAGELVVRLTYKAYVEDEEEPGAGDRPVTNKVWNEIGNFISKEMEERDVTPEKRQLRDSIVMSVDAQRGESGLRFSNPLMTQSANNGSTISTGVVNIDALANGVTNPGAFTSGPFQSSTVTNGSVGPSAVTNSPESPASLSNPAVEKQEERAENRWGLQFQRFLQENSALLWLAILTGVALLVALDLNLTNLFNP